MLIELLSSASFDVSMNFWFSATLVVHSCQKQQNIKSCKHQKSKSAYKVNIQLGTYFWCVKLRWSASFFNLMMLRLMLISNNACYYCFWHLKFLMISNFLFKCCFRYLPFLMFSTIVSFDVQPSTKFWPTLLKIKSCNLQNTLVLFSDFWYHVK